MSHSHSLQELQMLVFGHTWKWKAVPHRQSTTSILIRHQLHDVTKSLRAVSSYHPFKQPKFGSCQSFWDVISQVTTLTTTKPQVPAPNPGPSREKWTKALQREGASHKGHQLGVFNLLLFLPWKKKRSTSAVTPKKNKKPWWFAGFFGGGWETAQVFGDLFNEPWNMDPVMNQPFIACRVRVLKVAQLQCLLALLWTPFSSKRYMRQLLWSWKVKNWSRTKKTGLEMACGFKLSPGWIGLRLEFSIWTRLFFCGTQIFQHPKISVWIHHSSCIQPPKVNWMTATKMSQPKGETGNIAVQRPWVQLQSKMARCLPKK